MFKLLGATVWAIKNCSLGLFCLAITASAMAQSSVLTPQQLIERQVPAAVKILDAYHTADPVPSKRTLHIVYWTPNDREPIADYRERLTRVLFSIREFYKKEMVRLGFGERTIRLATEPDGLLKIHVVRGAEPYANYQVESGSKIRNECLPTLTAAGIEADQETIVLFCNMSNWDMQKMTMTQNSPYYASGGLRSGTAWQVDSALLDSQLLSAKEPLINDGQYGRISVGKYNSIFVGGVCHELGHALGLPHNMERPDERRAFGTALMGSGNRTFGDNLRGEGRGSFLTLAEGMRLASHPLFTNSEKGIDLDANAKLANISAELAADKKSFRFSAKVIADPPAYAVVGYIDPVGNSDYDATTVTAVPDANGNFDLLCSAFKKGKSSELRIVVCQANGGRIFDRVLEVPFDVDAEGKVDLSSLMTQLKLAKLIRAVEAGDVQRATIELASIEQINAPGESGKQLVEVARALTKSINFEPGPPPSDWTDETCWLPDAASVSASVGWLQPMVNRLPNDSVLISVNGQQFARGLYAHAPSEYEYDLGGKWSRLTGFAGMADSNNGTVVFIVEGDGKELWRSPVVSRGPAQPIDVLVPGVKRLKLKVEDGGDGKAADWGTWCDLKLHR